MPRCAGCGRAAKYPAPAEFSSYGPGSGYSWQPVVFDASDAGMVYWLITGGINGGDQAGSPAKLQAALALADLLPGVDDPNDIAVENPNPTTPAIGNAVVSATLINADTDTAIGSLDDWGVIDFSNLPTHNLNVRANTDATGSVAFQLDGAWHVENNAAFALGGNTGGDYYAWTPGAGSHTLVMTPYTGDDATGAAGTPLTIHFEVVEGTSFPPPEPIPPTAPAIGNAVVSATLINADTDTAIGSLDDWDVIDFSNLPSHNLNVRANTDATGSVAFQLDGAWHVENNAAFALGGNTGGDYYAWTPGAGSDIFGDDSLYG